ncbi:hypothetical protein CPT03_16745 [Pedobacter ginsengisoli]|uniref:Lipopolysaccharide biosynthesis protein n=1 Tax=Pedobacter ginsengisoli TaxID=363852 RepID=A0A2D1U8Q1_9SPHI|nr:hypothetical protein [Pedobacter ginsengisoli]ATP57995.1 hypothetical protein CPT03_16745 [Pedobacter ginsengisoli]
MMNNMGHGLRGKRILFVGPVFHDYHLIIINKLKEMGAEVSFFPERSYKMGFKLINNLLPQQLGTYQKIHYRKANLSSNYDYLFVIRGFMMPAEFVNKFKELNPLAKLIMYQWDSEIANPFSHLLELFDFTYSFDFEDCKTFPGLKYLPLFYSDDVTNYAKNKTNAEFDFFFMGFFFPERYKALLRFRDFATANNYKLKGFLYMPLTSYIKEILKGAKIDRTVVSLKPMRRNDYLAFLGNTKVMVDVSNPNQTGLAMRVIESLATNTKVLTNNFRLMEDSKIYDQTSIAFFDDNAPIVDSSFLKVDQEDLRNRVLSIKHWLELIFMKG